MSSARKDQHLDIVLAGRARHGVATGLDAVRFAHVALPEMALGDVDLTLDFLGRRIAAPVLVSAMTGGPARAARINARIAAACEALGLPFAVGSQRVALEGDGEGGLGADLRRAAPSVPILGNIGAAQLARGWGADEARRAVDMIGADALIVHLNPLQEALQPEGDRDWRGLLGRIGALARALAVPVVAKEVGAGLSGRVASALWEEGVRVLDVAGAGGTSWAAVEGARAADPRLAGVAATFADWGIPTARSVRLVREACPDATVIASGGLRSGLDVARAIRLGADLGGFAAGVLDAAVASEDALRDRLGQVVDELRLACFCTGSRDLEALRLADLIDG